MQPSKLFMIDDELKSSPLDTRPLFVGDAFCVQHLVKA